MASFNTDRLVARANQAGEADIRLSQLLDQLDRMERNLIAASGAGMDAIAYSGVVLRETKALMIAKQAYDAVRP